MTHLFPQRYFLIVLMLSGRIDLHIEGGCVFLAFNSILIMNEEPLLDAEAKIVWAKLQLSRTPSLYLCSFYRLPDSGTQSIIQLNESLLRLYNRNTLPNLILA